MSTALQVPKFLSRLVGAAMVAAFAVGAQADSLSIPDYSSRAEAGTLTFTGGTGNSTHTEGPAWFGSYQLSNGDWVYCLSPFTNAPVSPVNYDKVTLGQFLSTGGGYDQQFASANYQSLATGYAAQSNGYVLNKIVELYNHAFANTLTGTVQDIKDKSTGFAFALWEIEGEASGSWGTAAGNLQLGGVTLAAQTYANTLLGALSSGIWTGALAGITSYQFDVWQPNPLASSQSFLTVSTSPTNRTGVPEPATGMLLAAAALAFFGSRRVARRSTKLA